MSNRGRQNVASFLVKDLGLDWRLGAEWYACPQPGHPCLRASEHMDVRECMRACLCVRARALSLLRVVLHPRLFVRACMHVSVSCCFSLSISFPTLLSGSNLFFWITTFVQITAIGTTLPVGLCSLVTNCKRRTMETFAAPTTDIGP